MQHFFHKHRTSLRNRKKKIICSIPLPLMGFSGYFLRSFTYSPRHCSDITDIIIASLLANGTLSFKNPCRPAHQLIMLWQRSVRFAAFNWTSGKGTAHLGWLCCSTFSVWFFFCFLGNHCLAEKVKEQLECVMANCISDECLLKN